MGLWRSAVVGLVLVAVAGCAKETTATGGTLFSVSSLGAQYQLTAVADQPLPATAYLGVDVSAQATGGTLTLSGEGTYALNVQYVRHFASGNRDVSTVLAEQGKWSASRDNANAVILTPSTGSARKATAVGDNLVLTLTVPDSPGDRATKVYRFTKH